MSISKRDIFENLIQRGILKREKCNKVILTEVNNFPILSSSLESKDDDKILFLKTRFGNFEYWLEEEILIPPWKTHWFQLKNGFNLDVKKSYLLSLINRAKNKAGSLYALGKDIGMGSPALYNLVNFPQRKTMVSVRKAKRILKYLGESYVSLNKEIIGLRKGRIASLKKPKFPFNLATTSGAQILGRIVSDGSIYIDKKSRNQLRTKYCSSDQESINTFIRHIQEIFGDIHITYETHRGATIARVGSSLVGEALQKVGAIVGNKTSLNRGVPWLILKSSDLHKRSYLNAAFDDEGSIYSGPKAYQSFITLYRYHHIKFNANQELFSNMKKRILPTGHITKEITLKESLRLTTCDSSRELLSSPSKLITDEFKILRELGFRPYIFGRKLTQTHNGKWSLCYGIHISKNKDLINFYKQIGFTLSRKQDKLAKIVEVLENHTTAEFTNQEKRKICTH